MIFGKMPFMESETLGTPCNVIPSVELKGLIHCDYC